MATTHRLIEVFHEAKARRAGTDREQFLAAACRDDLQLKEHVVSLLQAHERAGDFLKPPPLTPPVPLLTEKPGERIGNYKLLEQIGEGGFGVVWVAEQERPIRRRVALKIIKLGMDTREVIARFEQERQALAMMDHPNIAKVLEAGAAPSGRPFFVMELVRGIKITEYCDQANLATAERLQIFIAVCQAVQHAHQKGIIHRDLKPSNILVTLHDGVPVPKVIDFGVAKATQQQRLTDLTIYTQFEQMIGTPLYMSPEQAEMSGLDIDTRSDIYSLGVLLYELLTGRTPFDPEELMRQGLDEIRRTIREQEPQTPSMFLRTMALDLRTSVAHHRHADSAKLIGQIRGDLDWIVMKALEKDRTRRYETASGLASDIQRHLQSEPVLARPPSQAYLFQRFVRRNFGSAGWAVALGVIWGIVGGVVCWLVMLNPLGLSVAVRRAIYLIGVGFTGSGGMITVWLVRPKNAAADLVGGTITGALAAVICYTLSFGWVAVSIAGVPYGIWLGMASAFGLVASLCIIETLAAGMLVRRHGNVSAAIVPYIELTIPVMLAVIFAISVLFRLATVGLGSRAWHLFMVPVLLLAIAGVLRGWQWRVRALLHAAWLTTLCSFGLR